MEWRGWQGFPFTVDLVQIDDHDGTSARQYEAENPQGYSLDYGAFEYSGFTDITFTPENGGQSRTFRARAVTAAGEGEWVEYSWPWTAPWPPG